MLLLFSPNTAADMDDAPEIIDLILKEPDWTYITVSSARSHPTLLESSAANHARSNRTDLGRQGRARGGRALARRLGRSGSAGRRGVSQDGDVSARSAPSPPSPSRFLTQRNPLRFCSLLGFLSVPLPLTYARTLFPLPPGPCMDAPSSAASTIASCRDAGPQGPRCAPGSSRIRLQS